MQNAFAQKPRTSDFATRPDLAPREQGFQTMTSLPKIMVAPNGARLTKADHPALPVTIDETVACAIACRNAGADGLHAHVRDAEQRHVLDAGLYSELLAEMTRQLPGFYAQITTEAVGQYSPAQQRALVETVRPKAVSIGLREIDDEPDPRITARFFAFCAEAEIHVQHILYDTDDISRFARLVSAGTISPDNLAALIVLGRYSAGQLSSPDDLTAPAAQLHQAFPTIDWSVCAFGPQETDCLVAAADLGGKARIGFENNRLNADGSVARDNAQRVAELVARLDAKP